MITYIYTAYQYIYSALEFTYSYRLCTTTVTFVYVIYKFFQWGMNDFLGYNIRKYKPKIIVVTGTSSASGKTTLAKKICDKYGYVYISIDNCKYGKNWSLKNGNEFRRNILMEMNKYSNNPNRFSNCQDGNTMDFNNHVKSCLTNNKYVIDGIYCDSKISTSKRHNGHIYIKS